MVNVMGSSLPEGTASEFQQLVSLAMSKAFIGPYNLLFLLRTEDALAVVPSAGSLRSFGGLILAFGCWNEMCVMMNGKEALEPG